MIFGISKPDLQKKLDEKAIKIAVYGLGRVGLPLAVVWLRAGYRVMGADIQRDVVQKINGGLSPIRDEPGVAEAVETYVKEGRFVATLDLVKASRESDVKFVAVPTTQSNKAFGVDAIENALLNIGRGLKKGDAVSIESSVPPTTTERWAKNILEEESGLRAEEDFALAFSPERIYEGRVLEDIEERYPKVVGGVGPKSTELFATLYSQVAKRGVIRMGSATAAEFSKLFEGIYRDVNIALANELAKVCEAFNVDFGEVREAANSQPFCHLHRPGVGVGGSCIPHYPYFVMEKAGEMGLSMPLTRLARTVNEEMPKYTIAKASEALKAAGRELSDIKVAILGLAFRGDVADSRNSPTYDLIGILKEYRAEVVVHDPLIEHDQMLEEKGVRLSGSVESAVRGASLVIIATDHREYRKIDLGKIAKMLDLPAAIVDGRNMIDAKEIPKGIYLTGIGRQSINKL